MFEKRTMGLTLFVVVLASIGIPAHGQQQSYGVDVSWPMHHLKVMQNPSDAMLGDRQGAYDTFMAGCDKLYNRQPSPCRDVERDRIQMNVDQPRSMQNYTEMGFKKIKCPESVYKLVKEFWDQNRNSGDVEQWFTGNTYTNHWEAASYLVNVENTKLRGGGGALQNAIWDAARSTIEEWTGEELTPCSLYGIRVYGNGAILAPHVDRLPLVSSAIINVDQDVDEPWPLEVIGHDGKAYNVTMDAGEMILYESHSIIHGRPFPMKGRFYANIFIHFEPVGHSLRHNVKVDALENEGSLQEKYRKSIELGHGGHENSQLPVYILPDTPAAQSWIASHPGGMEEESGEGDDGETEVLGAHAAAAKGDIQTLQRLAEEAPEDLIAEDENGWQPIHEAARSGHVKIVEFLIENGADINAQTNEGTGGTPLYWAQEALGEDHPVVHSLERLGAIAIDPDDLEL